MNKTLAQRLTLPGVDEPIDGPLGNEFNDIGDIVSKSTSFIFAIAGVLLLLMLISGGFAYMTSAGDAKKMEGAQQRLTNALIGFVIIFVAFWVVQLMQCMLGVDLGFGGFAGICN